MVLVPKGALSELLAIRYCFQRSLTENALRKKEFSCNRSCLASANLSGLIFCGFGADFVNGRTG